MALRSKTDLQEDRQLQTQVRPAAAVVGRAVSVPVLGEEEGLVGGLEVIDGIRRQHSNQTMFLFSKHVLCIATSVPDSRPFSANQRVGYYRRVVLVQPCPCVGNIYICARTSRNIDPSS